MSDRKGRQTAADDQRASAADARRKTTTRLRKQKPLRRNQSRLEAATAAWRPRLFPGEANRPPRAAATPVQPVLPASAVRRRVRNAVQPLRNFTFNAREIISSPRWISAMLLAMCAYALVLIGTNRRFYLDAIDVQGLAVLPAAEVISAGGILGSHVFAVNPDEVARKIGQLPGVKSTQVELRWPDAMTIVIEEDAPLLKWLERGELYWINAEGAILPAAQRDLGLLLIEADLPAPPPAPTPDPEAAAADGAEGQPAILTPNTYLKFVPQEVIDGALALRDLRPELTNLTYSEVGGLRFVEANGGWTVYLGTGDDMRVKLAVYDALIGSLQARGITPEYVNVSHLSKPVYKPLGGVQ